MQLTVSCISRAIPLFFRYALTSLCTGIILAPVPNMTSSDGTAKMKSCNKVNVHTTTLKIVYYKKYRSLVVGISFTFNLITSVPVSAENERAVKEYPFNAH